MPCLTFDNILPSVTQVVSSSQATPRHTRVSAYRCFLPDLTGFTDSCCVGPNCQHHLLGSSLTNTSLIVSIQPCCSGLQVEGTANSPPSTTNLKPMAERVGFEPTERGYVHSPSKRAPSTSRPSLRLY